MWLAVLSASGAEFDPDAYLRWAGLEPDAVWHVGEPRFRGEPHAESGFNICVADERSMDALVETMRDWLTAHRLVLAALGKAGAKAELDVGMTVGSAKQFAASVSLEPSDLALLAELGLVYCVSAYPAADDEDEDE